MFAEGGCACGAVRYRLKNSPLIVHACHCSDCQSLTGGPFAVNAWIEKNFLELISGMPAVFNRSGGSGQGHDVYFCSSCGSTVWSEYHRPPGSYWFVRVGTLDDPKLLAPDVHIFTRSKHPSVTLPEGVPVFDVSYEREKVWSAESLARMEANIRAG